MVALDDVLSARVALCPFGRIVVNQNGNTTFTEAMSKTDDARTVPVQAPVTDALLEHLKDYRPGAAREDFLFVNNRDGHILRSGFARDVLAKSVKRAGLEGRHVTWLTLRHTAASLMFDAGLSIFEVQQRLGHRSPTMTAEAYTHLMRERYEEGREKLEAGMRAHRSPDTKPVDEQSTTAS